MEMKGFFTGIVISVPVTAAILMFALQGKEEVRTEQQLQRAEQKVENDKFDKDLANMWNGGKMTQPTEEVTEAHKKELEAAKAERDGQLVESKEDLGDLRAAMKEITNEQKGGAK